MRVCEQRHELIHLNFGLRVHEDPRGNNHLDEFDAVGLSRAGGFTEVRVEPVEGNVLSITVMLATLGHFFRLTNLLQQLKEELCKY